MASCIETIVSMAQWAQWARWTEPTEPTEPLLLARFKHPVCQLKWHTGCSRAALAPPRLPVTIISKNSKAS
jgi:hypothetical protein